jgi:hypothetical protein
MWSSQKHASLRMVLLALALLAPLTYPVWTSATPDVAESYKINTQSACLRHLIMGSYSFHCS